MRAWANHEAHEGHEERQRQARWPDEGRAARAESAVVGAEHDCGVRSGEGTGRVLRRILGKQRGERRAIEPEHAQRRAKQRAELFGPGRADEGDLRPGRAARQQSHHRQREEGIAQATASDHCDLGRFGGCKSVLKLGLEGDHRG